MPRKRIRKIRCRTVGARKRCRLSQFLCGDSSDLIHRPQTLPVQPGHRYRFCEFHVAGGLLSAPFAAQTGQHVPEQPLPAVTLSHEAEPVVGGMTAAAAKIEPDPWSSKTRIERGFRGLKRHQLSRRM